MKKYMFMAVAGMLALSSCSNDENDIQDAKNAPRQMTFTAGFGDGAQTRASLDGSTKKVSFDANDEISILSTKNTNTKFTTSAGGASATFSGTATDDSKFYAVYPYTAGLTLSGNVISNVVIPFDQSAAALSACGWDPAAPIAYASTNGTSLTFHNACALLKIKNTCGYGDAQIFVDVNEESLVGTFDLDTSTGELTVQAGKGYYMVSATDVPNNKTIYLAIAPGTYTGLFVQCNYDNTNHCRCKDKSSVSFEAGKIYDLGNTGSWDVMF